MNPEGAASHFSGKVVHVATTDVGGAGISVRRLNWALQSIGVDSTLLTGFQSVPSQFTEVIPPPGKPPSDAPNGLLSHSAQAVERCFVRWHSTLETLYPNRPKDLELYSDITSEYRLDRVALLQNADIIHFHWVAGLVNFEQMTPLMRSKPVVWTLHDMNPFTGGCHYAGDCVRYQQTCGRCPQLASQDAKDLSAYNHSVKAMAYKCARIHVVTPSRWLATSASCSDLMRGFPISVISNSVPTELFAPQPRDEMRRELSLAADCKVLLFGSLSQGKHRKGFDLLLHALDAYQDTTGDYSMVLVSFGQSDADLVSAYSDRLINIGRVDDWDAQARLYSAADAFALPSREDNLPNTMLESLSCGTPVIAFRTGGMSDVIEHGRTGYLAEPFEVESLAKGIAWAFADGPETRERGARCRDYALRHFGPIRQAEAYLELYQSAV